MGKGEKFIYGYYWGPSRVLRVPDEEESFKEFNKVSSLSEVGPYPVHKVVVRGGREASYGEVEEVVLRVLGMAVEDWGGPASARQVSNFSKTLDVDEIPITPLQGHSGCWSPLDFEDRAAKWLNRLAKKGLVVKEGEGQRATYEPV